MVIHTLHGMENFVPAFGRDVDGQLM